MRRIGWPQCRPLACAFLALQTLLTSLALLPGTAVAQSSQELASQDPSPRILRQTVFNIPFTASDQVVEVHLFVSVDGGQSWQFYSRRHPSTGHFPFRAARDGRFWFASRTIDQSLQAPDTSRLRPE